MDYSTIRFLNDLKSEMCKILITDTLTDEKFSQILGQTNGHVKKKRNQIKKNICYFISLDVLRQYSDNLIKNLGHKANLLISLIEKYINTNDLPEANYGIFRFHPNLKINYFQTINTKEKAYWLGWLYAEGWLSKHGKYIRFGVEIHNKDLTDLLIKFCNSIGFNLEHLEDNIRRDGDLTDYVRIRFVNNSFTQNLINHGFIVGNKKSKNIELPQLNSRELYLAFILGFYDGDGKVGSTVITSASEKFINKVKMHFKISNKIWITESEWNGIGYNIYLGMNLMREMIANYDKSLMRKKKHFLKKKKEERLSYFSSSFIFL